MGAAAGVLNRDPDVSLVPSMMPSQHAAAQLTPVRSMQDMNVPTPAAMNAQTQALMSPPSATFGDNRLMLRDSRAAYKAGMAARASLEKVGFIKVLGYHGMRPVTEKDLKMFMKMQDMARQYSNLGVELLTALLRVRLALV